MAKPRVFVSSTYYDLRHIRASLDLFIDSLGFEPVLSEKGDIAYTHDRPLDESCYREAENSDVFVLVIGGRYGSEASSDKKRVSKEFFERYDSITRKEYESAAARDIPIYIVIDKGVYSEYQTYLRNKELQSISYAHVDSVNVFVLIEDILSRPRNNPIQTFEKFEEIQNWLREQWAGLFRELLRRQSQQQQLSGLSTQVGELKATNETLKKYLEAVMLGVDKKQSSKLIQSEEERLLTLRREELASANDWVRHVVRRTDLPPSVVIDAIRKAKTRRDSVTDIFGSPSITTDGSSALLETLNRSAAARNDLNEVRLILGLQPFDEEAGDTRHAHESDGTPPRPTSGLEALLHLTRQSPGNAATSTEDPDKPAAAPVRKVAAKKRISPRKAK